MFQITALLGNVKVKFYGFFCLKLQSRFSRDFRNRDLRPFAKLRQRSCLHSRSLKPTQYSECFALQFIIWDLFNGIWVVARILPYKRTNDMRMIF